MHCHNTSIVKSIKTDYQQIIEGMKPLFISKRTYKFRWFVVSLAVWLILGAYFCYDVPASLHNTLKNHMDNIDGDIFEIYFGGLYSVYAFANIFLPFISGGFRDVLGDRFVLIMLAILVILGQTIFTYGVLEKSFMIMYLGRIIVGWGIESMLPTLTSFITPYYREDYLAFSVGLNQLFAHVGLVICMLICPQLAISYGLTTAMAVGIFLNVFTFFFGIASILLDQNAEANIQPYDQLEIAADQGNEQPGIVRSEIVQYPAELLPPQEQEQQMGFFSHAFNFKEISQFPRLFWYMAIFYAIIYASVLALVNVSVGYFTETWLVGVDEPEKIASRMIAIMWFVTGSLTPIFGMIVDYFGHRSAISLLSASLCVTSHGLVLINQPFVGLMFLGFSLALAFATIWTGVIYVIQPDQYGKAYGVIVSLYNAGFTLVPLLVGVLRAFTKNYLIAQLFLAFLGVVAFIFSVLIYHEDHHTGKRIDKGLYVEHSAIDEFGIIDRENHQKAHRSEPVPRNPNRNRDFEEKKVEN